MCCTCVEEPLIVRFPLENTDRNKKNPNIETPKTASFMYKHWCQAAAIVATFKVNRLFLDGNTGHRNQAFTCSESVLRTNKSAVVIPTTELNVCHHQDEFNN